jgi:predicted Zn-dependent peptidase
VTKARLIALTGWLLLVWGWAFSTPERIRLSNGAEIIVERIPNAPLTDIEVWIRAGVANETPATSGVAHLLEHLIFKGTASLPPGALDTAFEQAGGILDATTERDWTRYRASVLPDQWQEPLQTLLRCLLNPALDEKQLEQERRLILNDEYALHRADPIRPARYALFAEAFPNHPYGLPLLGDPTTLTRHDIQTVRQFHRRHYLPERMIIVVVGAAELEAVRKVVEAAWGSAESSAERGAMLELGGVQASVLLPSPPDPLSQGVGEGKPVSVARDAWLALGIRTPPASDIDAWLCAEITRIALAEPYRGLLYEGEGALPFGRLQSEYLPRTGGSLLAFYALPPVEADEEWQAATRQRFERALVRIAEGNARVALEQARAVALARHETAMRNPLERARWYGLCAVLQIPLSPEEYAVRLKNLPVEQLETFVRARAGLPSQSETAVSNATAQGTSQPPAGNPLRYSSVAALASSTRPASRRVAVRQRLANGLRVVAVSAPDADSVVIHIVVGHTLGESAAVGELTARMLFGETQNETERTLAMRIARSGGSLSVEWTPAGARITAFARPDSVVNILSLLKESLLRAEFNDAGRQRALRQAIYDRQYREGASAWRLGATLLNAYGSEESLKGVSLNAVRAYYQKHYRPENTVIVAAGNLPVERLIEMVQQFWGGDWEQLPTPRTPVSPVGTTLRLGAIADPRGCTYTGYAWASDVESPADYHALLALQALLMEGKRARIFVATREQQGVGYALIAETALGKGFALGFGATQTGKTPLPQNIVQQALRQPIQPHEWQRVQQLLRGEWERLRLSLHAFTAALAWAELSGLGYETVWNAPDILNALSLQSVEAQRGRLVSSLRDSPK